MKSYKRKSKQIKEIFYKKLILFCNILESLCDLLPHSVTISVQNVDRNDKHIITTKELYNIKEDK